jgi:hypothetical protein
MKMDLNTAYHISAHPEWHEDDWRLLRSAAEVLLDASKEPNGTDLDIIRASQLINRVIVLQCQEIREVKGA